MANVGKWYTKSIYFNSEGVEITKKDADKNYIKLKKTKNVKIEGNTGYIEYWYQCERSRQRKLF